MALRLDAIAFSSNGICGVECDRAPAVRGNIRQYPSGSDAAEIRSHLPIECFGNGFLAVRKSRLADAAQFLHRKIAVLKSDVFIKQDDLIGPGMQ